MIVVTNRIYVNPDHVEAFETRFKDRAGAVDGMPGFVSFQFLRPKTEGAPYCVMTYWETEDAFRAWTESSAFRKGHARSGTLPEDTFTRPSEIEVCEVIA